ncbi:MAG: D-alanyl-D-alanine carboxypeptidase family protein [Actinomycetota bacterium]
MTLLLCACVAALSLGVGTLIAAVGSASDLDARVQLAADAAALAAVAESAPYGRGIPTQVARRYAEANGAELLGCRCEGGATSMEVTVGIDGATARARSIIDPRMFAPLIASTRAAGLHPQLKAAVDRLVEAAAGRVVVRSGFRTSDVQAALWVRALARYGTAESADDWVARPGSSMHERGLAVDLGGDLDLAARLVTRLGLPLHRPLSHEPWHFELLGTR